MRIGELAAKTSVNIQTIRFYERRELLKSPARLASGYRNYAADAVRRVRYIKRSQEVVFTLKEIKHMIGLREQRLHSAADVRAIAQAKLRSIDEKIRTLESMREELTALVTGCQCGEAQPMCSAMDALDV